MGEVVGQAVKGGSYNLKECSVSSKKPEIRQDDIVCERAVERLQKRVESGKNVRGEKNEKRPSGRSVEDRAFAVDLEGSRTKEVEVGRIRKGGKEKGGGAEEGKI